MIVAFQMFIVQAVCRYYSGDKLFESTRFERLNLHHCSKRASISEL